MSYLRALVAAFSMFTAIPMPQVEWDMEHGSRMTACFGLCGAVLGALALAAAWVVGLLPIPALLAAVAIVAVWHGVTGFLHLDGFMDVCDALLSHRDAEGRRRILKDPHCGAYSVICLLLTLAAEIAAVQALPGGTLSPLLCIALPMLSRSIAGLLLLRAPTLPESSLGAYFKTGASPAVYAALIATAALSLALAVVFAGLPAALTLAIACAVGALLGWYAAHRLGGVNGDVAGFTVVVCEVATMVAWTVV